MFVFKTNIPRFFPIRGVLKEALLRSQFLYYHGRVDTVAKRGSMLEDMVANKDKRKNWHMSFVSTKPKVRLFEKIHRPHRRRAVLNSLFISNITDVISTGDIAPEIINYGIEITGVQVSPCNKILNVFWQVPVSRFESCEDIGKLLNAAAPKIRAELISRNVLGRVPFIFFLRDSTNAKVAAFEKAMQKLDTEPKSELGVTVDDSFIKDMYSFKKTKVVKKDTEPFEKEEKEEMPIVPHRPLDMKCDVLGLNHELLMEKVIALKKKKKDPTQKTALISPESLKDADDLFCKIPGIRFQVKSDEVESRDAILKKFQVERKMLMQKNKKRVTDDNHPLYEDTELVDESELNEVDYHYFIEDEIEDD